MPRNTVRIYVKQPPRHWLQHPRLAIDLPVLVPGTNTPVFVGGAEILLTRAEGKLDGLVVGDLPVHSAEDHARRPEVPVIVCLRIFNNI